MEPFSNGSGYNGSLLYARLEIRQLCVRSPVASPKLGLVWNRLTANLPNQLQAAVEKSAGFVIGSPTLGGHAPTRFKLLWALCYLPLPTTNSLGCLVPMAGVVSLIEKTHGRWNRLV